LAASNAGSPQSPKSATTAAPLAATVFIIINTTMDGVNMESFGA
jgi:hypothetical protein